jgi:hypothetical protein
VVLQKETPPMLDLSASQRKTTWLAKDQAKARRARLFIGRGSPASSTEAYRVAAGSHAILARTCNPDDRETLQ